MWFNSVVDAIVEQVGKSCLLGLFFVDRKLPCGSCGQVKPFAHRGNWQDTPSLTSLFFGYAHIHSPY